MLGPVSLLQFKGMLCPCLTSPQESATNNAISTISNLYIEYSTENASDDDGNGNDKQGVGKFVSNLFSNAAAAVSSSTTSDGISSRRYKRGRVKIKDSMRGPILSFERESSNNSLVSDNEPEDDSNDNATQEENLTIALKRVGDIEPNNSFMSSSDAGLIIYKNNSMGPNNTSNDEKVELIRFNVIATNPYHDDTSSEETNYVDAEDRDDIIQYLKSIVDWDRNRRKMDPNTATQEDDNDEDMNKHRSGIGQRALKAKYFIQKEIEMKKQAKDRESRKERYMKDSGGLKYTALAMANREMT